MHFAAVVSLRGAPLPLPKPVLIVDGFCATSRSRFRTHKLHFVCNGVRRRHRVGLSQMDVANTIWDAKIVK